MLTKNDLNQFSIKKQKVSSAKEASTAHKSLDKGRERFSVARDCRTTVTTV